MTNDLIMDAIGYLDETMLAKHLETKEKYRQKAKRKIINNIIRWSAIAAGFALVAVVSIHMLNRDPFGDQGTSVITDPQAPESVVGEVDALQGIYLNGKRYKAETKLSKEATEQNFGDPVGFVSFGNDILSDICAYEYLPDDGKTNRIIFEYDGVFYVYSFHSYVNDGTDDWPVKLFGSVSSIEIRDPSYGMRNETVYAKITECDALLALLTELKDTNRKYDMKELSQYFFEKFKDQFAEGQIWISESGNIANGGDAAVAMKVSELIAGQNRHIIIIFDDRTELLYDYLEGAGVVVCTDFGYVLTEEQIAEINRLVGLN